MESRQLLAEARAHRAAGRLGPAITALSAAVRAAPADGIAHHNLAAALGDAGRWREAEAHARHALSTGLDAAETWLVLARALTTLQRIEEAEAAFVQALHRRADLYDAHKEFAQLRWMQRGDLAYALTPIYEAEKQRPQDTQLKLVHANVLQNAGEGAEAHTLVMALLAQEPENTACVAAAARSALSNADYVLALQLSERLVRKAGAQAAVLHSEALLANGDPKQALAFIELRRAKAPNDQHAIALEATAWRLLGDARYREIYDYPTFVKAFPLATPQGWQNLSTYVEDLSAALAAAHGFRAHPFNQSVKWGTQIASILDIDHPAVQALPEAIDAPLHAYIDALPKNHLPMSARNLGGYELRGIWSILTRAGGHHINHVHPEGWLSSACHLIVPHAPGREGWVSFGAPGIPCGQKLDAEHFVRPSPGMFVLFPSYMWHGTIPFTGEDQRLAFALDAIPA